ncbi:hypothetical protein FFWV33_09470 [Flavobacterium faecale]|uniref:Uncharacterized protein n=1 Tax=Flavobacterium faecale TaxID=1355330 RepID=A0A2S1LDB6_9FLAO|nr:hypothetical protein [Flavobacterium faecale]AWG21753.1 hypothetical protein FFWV33_09470 [Flavobacterium faecale]
MIFNKYNFFFFLLVISMSVQAQVKIGDNPSVINQNSLLELESSSKVLVLSRVTSSQMNAITPLYGALVYNIDEKCVFMFQGLTWKSLCGTSTTVTTSTTQPIINNRGDIWVNNATVRNIVSVGTGTTWIPINSNPKSGAGTPNSQPNLNPNSGDIYVDESTTDLYIYNGTSWINSTASAKVAATNGLTLGAGNTLELGGALTKPTTIATTTSNTLAITGLQNATTIEDNEIVVVDKSTGVLKKIEASSLIREEEIVLTAISGQSQFSPPYPIVNPKQIDVYRNGVRIAFTVVNATTIEVEPEAVCYQGDKIRIVQLY